jgi:TonB-linked SusC/RagA family outer membrane protein
MKKQLFLLAMMVISATMVFAQVRTVTGKVIDDKGDPVSGASITVKGTSRGASANNEGTFSISAKTGDLLVISSTNYGTKEVTVGEGSNLSITLSRQAANIDEVVVTALGIRREKRSLGYSVAQVSGEDLTKGNNQNVVNSLNGRVSGVQVVSSGGAPGQASRIVIRGGAKSITGNNEPLFVIDGIPMTNANDGSGTSTEVEGVATPNRAGDINPDDIESISILKGSSASVLYGNRGANGVVLITTKSGRGRGGLPVVTFNSTTGFDNPLKLPDFQTVFAQGGSTALYAEGGSRSFGPRIMGQKVFSRALNDSIILQAYDPRADFLKTGITYNNNLSIAQSKENTIYYLSVNHSRQTSIVPNQDYNKASLRLNVNNQVSSKFNIGMNVNYLRTWGDVPYLGQDGSNPFFALYNMPISWDVKRFGYQRANGAQINFRGGSFDNPLWTANKTFFNTQNDRLIGAVTLGYKVIPGVDITYRLGMDQLNDDRKSFKDINSGSAPNGALANDNINRQEITSTFLVNVNKRLNQDFGLTFTGGHDFNQRRIKNYTQTGTALVVPGVAHMSNVVAFDPDYEFRSLRRLVGVFGDLKFDYQNFLFVGVTARNEWSSTLPVQNRSYFYPGVNGSFVFTDAFKMGKNILNYGKLRVAYAKTARDADPYQVVNTFVSPGNTIAAGYGDGSVSASAPLSFPFNGTAGYTLNNVINNSNLKAESTTEFEVGAELRFFKDRLNLDVTYFSNKNKDQIIPVDISPSTGATNFVVNSGLTRVKGLEVAIGITPVKTSSFTWTSNIVLARTRSKLIETYPGVEQIYLGGFSGNPAIYAIKNLPYGSIIGTGYQKDANGNVLVGDDGAPLFVDGVNLGKVEPDWTGGIRNTFTYNSLSLDFLIDARHGGYLYNGTEELLDFYGVTQKTASREDDFIFPGVRESDGKPNATVVKRDANWWSFNQSTEEYVYKNNWVRLREANLSYSIAMKNTKVLKSATVGVYGRNLWLNSDIPHVDPESSAFGTGNGQGATRMSFPTLRSIGFNLKFVF